MNTNELVNVLANATGLSDAQKTQGYDTAAEVRRIEGGTAWVHIPGGADETPVALTISARPGDTVQVRVAGGTAYIVGNATAPPTDDRTAKDAQDVATYAAETADEAQDAARTATRTAGAAQRIAGNTAQYFWHTDTGTDTGAHITEVTREEFLADPTNGGGNLLARSNGIAVRDGLTELATFSASEARVGSLVGGHTVVAADGMKIYGNDGTTELANIGFGEGTAESGTADAPYYSFGRRYIDAGRYAGNYSVAEGIYAEAAGIASHAEGRGTRALGGFSHAQGGYTSALGDMSFAAGYSTATNSRAQTAIGSCNIYDLTGSASTRGTYVLIIGNGTSTANRSNALTVDWGGNIRIALDVTAATGTEDGDLYAAITALGWSGVIE